MSKGLSWRQRRMLSSISHEAARYGEKDPASNPVAWRAIDYGPTQHTRADWTGHDYFSPQAQWNIEQATRRSLRSLERRGLVKLDRYCFLYDGADNVWSYVHPDDHVPGQGRIMTGVLLTEAGRAVAAEVDAETAARRLGRAA